VTNPSPGGRILSSLWDAMRRAVMLPPSDPADPEPDPTPDGSCGWCPDPQHPEAEHHPLGLGSGPDGEHIARRCRACGQMVGRASRGGPWRHLTPADHPAALAPLSRLDPQTTRPTAIDGLFDARERLETLTGALRDMARNGTDSTREAARYLLSGAGLPVPDDPERRAAPGRWVAGWAPEVEAWIKRTRDGSVLSDKAKTAEWYALDALLDDFRDHVYTGTPLDEEIEPDAFGDRPAPTCIACGDPVERSTVFNRGWLHVTDDPERNYDHQAEWSGSIEADRQNAVRLGVERGTVGPDRPHAFPAADFEANGVRVLSPSEVGDLLGSLGTIEDDLRAVGDPDQAAADDEAFESLTGSDAEALGSALISTPAASVSLRMVAGLVRLTNESAAPVRVAVGDQSAILEDGDSLGLHVPPAETTPPVPSPNGPVPAGLAAERLRVLSGSLFALRQFGPGQMIDYLDRAGWSVVPHTVAADMRSKLGAATNRQLARALAERLPGLYEFDPDADPDGAFVPVAAADLADRVAVALPAACAAVVPGEPAEVQVGVADAEPSAAVCVRMGEGTWSWVAPAEVWADEVARGRVLDDARRSAVEAVGPNMVRTWEAPSVSFHTDDGGAEMVHLTWKINLAGGE
jgi:hypothetical protein